MVKLVWCCRLEPWVIQGLSEIPNARKKISIFCEGLVSLDRKQRLEKGEKLEQIETDSPTREDIQEQIKKNIFPVKYQKDVLQTEEDSLPKEPKLECKHDYQPTTKIPGTNKMKFTCTKCGSNSYSEILNGDDEQ